MGKRTQESEPSEAGQVFRQYARWRANDAGAGDGGRVAELCGETHHLNEAEISHRAGSAPGYVLRDGNREVDRGCAPMGRLLPVLDGSSSLKKAVQCRHRPVL